jgi:quercetin 2,3-dioxygenase
MIAIRRSSERGHFDHGWLDTYHTFSFGDYRDPNHMGFRSLRVINEDRVAPGGGFPMHPHRDMEIITYIVSGTLEHKDSLGGSGTINRGQIQRITAGRGIEHSECNASHADPVHLLQIWIRPQTKGADPSYDQQDLPGFETPNHLHLIASPDGAESAGGAGKAGGAGGAGKMGSMTIGQDVSLYACVLETGHQLSHAIAPSRGAWLQLISGSLSIGGSHATSSETLNAGDGAAVSDEPGLDLTALQSAEFLLFDLA